MARIGPADVFRWGFAAAPTIAVLAPLGLAPLAAVMTVASLALHWGRRRELPAIPLVASVLAAVIVFWAGLSVFWAVDFDISAHLWPSVAAYFAGGIFLIGTAAALIDGERARVSRALIAGIAVAMVLLTIEGVTGGGIQQAIRLAEGDHNFRFLATFLNRATALLAILAWPAAIVVRRRYGTMAGIFTVIGLLGFLAFFSSEKSILGVVGGGAVFIVARLVPKCAARILGAAIVLSVLISPAVFPIPFQIYPVERQIKENMPVSIWHRFIIWDFASRRALERPLLGWGLNSSRVIPGGKDQMRPGAENLPLHPHSAPLQLWLELGSVGALLAALLAAAGTCRIGSYFSNADDRAFALGMVGCFMTIAFVGYGIWQGWWVGAVCICFAVLAAVRPPDSGLGR